MRLVSIDIKGTHRKDYNHILLSLNHNREVETYFKVPECFVDEDVLDRSRRNETRRVRR
jgi:hypothetical protein